MRACVLVYVFASVLCPMCGVCLYFSLCKVAGSSLLWQVFKVLLHAAREGVCLCLCVCVCAFYVFAGVKPIVRNLWVWSAVEINIFQCIVDSVLCCGCVMFDVRG